MVMMMMMLSLWTVFFTWAVCSHPAANAARGRPDFKRRIGFASLTMSSLSWVWKDKRLTTATKVHLYQALVMSVLCMRQRQGHYWLLT